MDNSTYDVVNLPPINTNDTYSTLETIPTKVNQSYETKRNEDIIGHGMKYVEQNTSNGTTNKKKNKQLLVVIIIMMVIFLLISIASLTLSAAAYNQMKPEQSTSQIQQSNANNDLQSQFDATCSNISQMLFQLDTKVNALLLRNTDMEPQSNCGPGLWYQVAHLNMTDPSQQCPCVWREYNQSEIRACGRPVSSDGGCVTNRYLISNQYRRVCGRVIGYQVASPDAFGSHGDIQINFDGVNITSGAQHDHVWSYVAGFSEIQSQSSSDSKCPCSTINGRDPPPFIGDNYYCESGNPNNRWTNNRLYTEDKLWDGLQCEGTCCNSTMTPPWFSVQLAAPTTMLEVSICGSESTNNEDTPIELLEIYVQ